VPAAAVELAAVALAVAEASVARLERNVIVLAPKTRLTRTNKSRLKNVTSATTDIVTPTAATRDAAARRAGIERRRLV